MQRPERSDYHLGALIKEERRLILVPVDPAEPWEAFRRMRSWMRTAKKPVEVDIFRAPGSAHSAAKVVSMESWRARASGA
ncbi:MAG: hypothetical protein HY775_02110 [Acidobacteria bacterium]|nr:hypothetical protein [Acidobacteriota bacterium]